VRPTIDEPIPEASRPIAAALQTLQAALLNHPVATQAAFATLVAEGKQFAETPAGQEWAAKLAGSDLIRSGRVIWEVMTQSAFTAERDTVLPSVLLDAFARASAISALEPFLSVLFEEKL
jgi:hypothetical protein